jgi:hypothetical protein
MKARIAALALLVLLSGCASQYFRDAGAPPAETPRYSLRDLPQPEYWTGFVLNGAKIGFSHTRVVPAAGGLYELQGEAVLAFRLLGVNKSVQVHSADTVDANARLIRFAYHYVVDDTAQDVSGEVEGQRLRYRVSTGGRPPEEKEETLAEPLYPVSALDLLPVFEGLAVGKTFRWLVFNGEVQQTTLADQRILSYETSELFEGPAYKVQTDLLGLHSTTWIDARGLPVFELGMNGAMISALEEERVAKGYLTSAAVNKDEAILDWSLIKAPMPLRDPRQARFMRFALHGPGPDRVPPADARQRCAASARDLVCEIDSAKTATDDGAGAAALLPSGTVQSRDPVVRHLASTIAGQKTSADDKIDAVLGWIDRNIAKEAIDTFSALDVLDARRAECQGHAYVYAALMRALEVPTRVVNGLVYSPDFGGFLYHTWAESLTANGWRAVDPTFNQPRADATHIALVRGESLADLTPLVDWVGNTRIEVLEAR